MTNKGKAVIAVLVKNLIRATYKTRLAAELGEEKVEEIYSFLLKETEKAVEHFEGSVEVFFHQKIPSDREYPFFIGLKKNLQNGNDLGEKMSNAIVQLLQAHEAAIVIGSDCPLLSQEHLQLATEKLENNDVVIGPAEDGGYYLIGMKKYYPGLFTDIDWSTDQVLVQTLEKAKATGLNVGLLETLYDIDYAVDWKRYLSETGSSQAVSE